MKGNCFKFQSLTAHAAHPFLKLLRTPRQDSRSNDMQRVENWRGKVRNQPSEGPKSRSGALLATQNDQRDVQEAHKGSQQVNEGIKAFPKCSFWGLCHFLGSVLCFLGVVWGPKKRSKKRRKCEKWDFEAARRRDQKYIEKTMKKWSIREWKKC